MVGLGLVHAFVLTALVYAINARSGAQLNPAVTIAFLVSRKMRGVAALTIACQVLGAVIGAAVVYSMFGSEMAASVSLPKDGNVIRALILETVSTFTLVYVVLATMTSKDNKIAPLAGVAIGFTLGFNFILGGPISGGAMNPARAFAPALIVWNFDYQYIYWVAPILGGIIAAGLYKGLHSPLDLPSPKAEQIK
jgi:MIP family channel proteins